MENGFKKKEELFNAALKEFSEQGFQNASLNNILKQAKVSKGVFYHYFENKDALYLNITGALFEKKKAFIIGKMTPMDMSGDIFHILRTSITLGLEFGASNPEYAKFSSMLMRERGNEIFIKVMNKYNVNNDAYVSSLIQKGISNGSIRSDLSIEFVMRMITYLLDHINEVLDTKGLDDYKSKVDELLSFMESGFKAENKMS